MRVVACIKYFATYPACAMAAETYYRNYIGGTSNFKTEYGIAAAHAMVTEYWGNPCDYYGSPYINNCGYNTAFEMLDHFYGGLERPSANTVARGHILLYDQEEFFSGSSARAESIADVGFVYIPTGCQDDASHCRVHITLHGCLMYFNLIGEDYIRHTGYNEVAELNDIIIIYPQTIAKMVEGGNNIGCWDWWGYTGAEYAGNQAPQMKFIKQLLDRVTS